MDFYQDKFQRGNPIEYVFGELCKLNGLPVEYNPAPEQDYAARAAYDVLVGYLPIEVKSDYLSWKTGNIAIEKASLDHTQSFYFAYAIPSASGISFHLFTVEELQELYDAYPKRIVGDQLDNYAVTPSKNILKTHGQPFYLWTQTIKQSKFQQHLTA